MPLPVSSPGDSDMRKWTLEGRSGDICVVSGFGRARMRKGEVVEVVPGERAVAAERRLRDRDSEIVQEYIGAQRVAELEREAERAQRQWKRRKAAEAERDALKKALAAVVGWLEIPDYCDYFHVVAVRKALADAHAALAMSVSKEEQ